MSSPRLPVRLRMPDFLDGQHSPACSGVSTDAFYPEKGETALTARRVCNRCPLQDECLDWALTTEEPHGVWGGLTAKERRNRRKATAAQYPQAA